MAVFLNGPVHEMFYTYNKVNKRQKLRGRIACSTVSTESSLPAHVKKNNRLIYA